MRVRHELDTVLISFRAQKLRDRLLQENPRLEQILRDAHKPEELDAPMREWVMEWMNNSPHALKFYQSDHINRVLFEALSWRDYAAVRLLDYLDHAGSRYDDPNFPNEDVVTNPFQTLWLAVHHGTGGANPDFFEDMLNLFRQWRGDLVRALPDQAEVESWMGRHPSGLDARVMEMREANRDHIIEILIDELSAGRIKSHRYRFEKGMARKKKRSLMMEWWQDHRFHLSFAVRDPDLLNRMLDRSLDPGTMKVLYAARDKGIPFFVNPYYLSLLNTRDPDFARGSDLAIRSYILYTKPLVEQFGEIMAWEKEDVVEPGKPNAAGWLLPSHHSVHRRYPNVAILIPDTVGRACGGLCASCQRMYDFQSGHLNFDLSRLKPKETWPNKLERLLEYFEEDTQLRDILVTGGDALMSSDRSMQQILDGIYRMAVRKKEANERRKDGDKYAELLRVRLGTRLPVYLPQRITPNLLKILADFKRRAARIGVRQFVIQTHFISGMEVTPEAAKAVKDILSTGWFITNQMVFAASAARRGHTARLRQVLNEAGVLPYYTFSVKGYMENQTNFATNARLVQEMVEEKRIGVVPHELLDAIRELPHNAPELRDRVAAIRTQANLPFMATDRSVLNLPGVGKSLTFRVVGITRWGRRILEFDHDPTRTHSPIIERMGKVTLLESKSIRHFLDQLDDMGEDPNEYESIWGYSIGATEPRMPVYRYPEYTFNTTTRMSNLKLPASRTRKKTASG